MKKLLIILFVSLISAKAFADNPAVNPITGSASFFNGLTVFGAMGIGTSVPNMLLDVRGGIGLGRRGIADTNATIAATDYTIAYTSISAARVVSVACTLGSAAAPQIFIVKDESGNAGVTNTITVTPTSGTIDGVANKSFNSAYGFIRFYANGTNCFQD